jgi:hypothetical protein
MPVFGQDLLPGEHHIDTWALKYCSPGGSEYEGKCMITDRRLLFIPVICVKKGQPEPATVNSNGQLEINKNMIREVTRIKTYIENQVKLKLENGLEYAFSYGALNIDRIADAIETGSTKI